jgi:6-pyruvoyltetrahydropterin/6-carboxytetrahydropterin synthase
MKANWVIFMVNMEKDQWIIYKEFSFEAAHRLPHHDGKCSRLHGHSWIARVYIKGNAMIEEGAKTGMIIDYGDIKNYVKPLLDNYLDHYYLNETTGLDNPTSEALAKWIYEKLEEGNLPGLYAVEIKETCTSGCYYSKPK